jgi:hypothetical protein
MEAKALCDRASIPGYGNNGGMQKNGKREVMAYTTRVVASLFMNP